jgi:hypothetical protein
MTRRAATAAVCVTLLCFSGCRLTDVWSGVRVDTLGRSLEVAAKPPLCACITFQNRTNQPVYIDSSLDDANTGDGVVPAQSQLAQRFDWAGPRPNDFYVLRAWTANSTRLHFGDNADVSFTVTPWADCAKTACQFAPMMMNVGLTGRNPGDR